MRADRRELREPSMGSLRSRLTASRQTPGSKEAENRKTQTRVGQFSVAVWNLIPIAKDTTEISRSPKSSRDLASLQVVHIKLEACYQACRQQVPNSQKALAVTSFLIIESLGLSMSPGDSMILHTRLSSGFCLVCLTWFMRKPICHPAPQVAHFGS